MLSFFKNLFGSKPAEPVVEVPYKVEKSAQVEVAKVETAPAVKAVAKKAKASAKKSPARKPKASK
jgi:hypothetical protein